MPNPIASALASLATSYKDYLLDKQYQQMIDNILKQISQPYQLPQTTPESKIPQVPQMENIIKQSQQPETTIPLPTPTTTETPAPIPTTPQTPVDAMAYLSTQEEQINKQINDIMLAYQKQKDTQTKALLELTRNPAFRMMSPDKQQSIMQMTAIATEPKIDTNAINSLIKAREDLRRTKVESVLKDMSSEKELEKQKQLKEWELKQYEPQVKEIEGEKVLYFPRTGEILPVKDLAKKKWVFMNAGDGVIVRADADTGEMSLQSVNPQINIGEILEKEARDRNMKVEDVLEDPFLTISILFKHVPNTDALKDVLTAIKWAYSLKKQPTMFPTQEDAIVSANKLKKLYPNYDFVPDPDPRTGGYDIKVYKITGNKKTGYTKEEAEAIAQEINEKHPGYTAIAIPTRNKGEWTVSVKSNNLMNQLIGDIYGIEPQAYNLPSIGSGKQPQVINIPQIQNKGSQIPQSNQQPPIPTSKDAQDVLRKWGLLK